MPTTVINLGPTPEQMGVSIAKWIQAKTIELAIEIVAKEQRAGFDANPVVVVDGVPGRTPSEVKPFGKIEFVARQAVVDIIEWTIAELIRRSPVGPAAGGHYRDDFIVLLNNVQVKGNLRVALSKLQTDDLITISNPRPYARRLESATASKRGREKRKAASRQAPGGIFRPVHRTLIQRFGRTVFVDFRYVKLNTGLRVMGKVGGKSDRKVLRDQVYPALVFKIKPSQATVN